MANKKQARNAGWQWAAVAAVVLVAGGGWIWWSQFRQPDETVAVTMPTLNDAQASGQEAFAANCAVCHGPNAGGTDAGPPLIHRVYEPGHHGDMSFVMAVQRGVRQHHWKFGNMPAQPQVSEAEIADIIAYVRAVQRANGIR
ncbi:MAG: cytochrome c [Alphaproteobacteria bacterium]